MPNDTQAEAAERRRFFRIDDHVSLEYRVIADNELIGALARLESEQHDPLSLASGFAAASTEMRHSLERFRRDMPDVASYLDALNGKLDLLVQLMATREGDLSDAPTHDVNLSASGIAFTTHEPLPTGSHVEVKVLLFPSYTCVLAFGEVVHCGPAEAGRPSGRYAIGVNFTHLRESDRDLIARHVAKRQASMLREARLAQHGEE